MPVGSCEAQLPTYLQESTAVRIRFELVTALDNQRRLRERQLQIGSACRFHHLRMQLHTSKHSGSGVPNFGCLHPVFPMMVSLWFQHLGSSWNVFSAIRFAIQSTVG